MKLVRANLLQYLFTELENVSEAELKWALSFFAVLDLNAPGWNKAFEKGVESAAITAIRNQDIEALKNLNLQAGYKFSALKACFERDSLSRWRVEDEIKKYLYSLWRSRSASRFS